VTDSDLVQWLHDQLDKDETSAGQWHDLECDIHTHLGSGLLAAVAASQMLEDVPGAVCDCGGPARALAEVQAKRQIIEIAPAHASAVDCEHGCCHLPDEILAGTCPNYPPSELPLLRLLALPYAGRPGYSEEWRPTARPAS
jgi:hypothetical protein